MGVHRASYRTLRCLPTSGAMALCRALEPITVGEADPPPPSVDNGACISMFTSARTTFWVARYVNALFAANHATLGPSSSCRLGCALSFPRGPTEARCENGRAIRLPASIRNHWHPTGSVGPIHRCTCFVGANVARAVHAVSGPGGLRLRKFFRWFPSILTVLLTRLVVLAPSGYNCISVYVP